MKRKTIFNRGKGRKGITLAEILIVGTIMAVLITGGISFLNPKQKIEYAWDMKRRTDVKSIQKIVENYHNDKEAYPDSVLCDTGPTPGPDGSCICSVCTLNKSGINKYTNTSYCDPEYPLRTYVYMYDCANTKPGWYQLCSSLNSSSDEKSTRSYGGVFNYGVASPQTTFSYCLPQCPGDAVRNKFCPQGENNDCNVCGSFNNCLTPGRCNSPVKLYKDTPCTESNLCYY